MAKSVNQLFLIGRLTRDVELRTTASGKSVATFSLAVDRGQDQTDFFDVTAWEKLAELMDKYTQKGSRVHVQGSLQQESWEDKETGKKRSKVVINARDVTFLDSKSEGSHGAPQQRQDVTPEAIDNEPIDLSKIPF